MSNVDLLTVAERVQLLVNAINGGATYQLRNFSHRLKPRGSSLKSTQTSPIASSDCATSVRGARNWLRLILFDLSPEAVRGDLRECVSWSGAASVPRPSRWRVTSAARHPGVRTRTQSPAETRTFLDAVDVHPKTLILSYKVCLGRPSSAAVAWTSPCLRRNASSMINRSMLSSWRGNETSAPPRPDLLIVLPSSTPNTKRSAALRSSRTFPGHA